MLAWVCLLSLLPALRAAGDQVDTETSSEPGAKIVAFDGGELFYRSGIGKLRRVWIDEVTLIVVDRGGIFDDFNQAERFMARGEAERAIARYRRVASLCEDFWTDLVLSRLVRACDLAGQLEKATLNLIRVVKGRWAGPAAAARLIPENIPEKLNRRVTRALQQLDAALRGELDESQRVLLALFRYEILRRTDHRRADEAAQRLATDSIPGEIGSEAVYDIYLRAMESAFDDGAEAEELAGLDRAVRDCPESNLPSFLLLKGRTLLRTAVTREDIVRASWPLMRVAVHFPDDPRGADGLLGAAGALERIGRAGKAVQLLEECLARNDLTDSTRRKARSALARLQSARGD